ncbi:hypothetical protein CRG98_044898, partial [Punica granatum]
MSSDSVSSNSHGQSDEQWMSPYEYEVNATFLLYHNQRFVQQLNSQRDNMNVLNGKIQALRENRASYDAMLVSINQEWNQVIDDLIFLEARAGGLLNALKALNNAENSGEENFLSRLLETDSIATGYIDGALANRCLSTERLIKLLEDAINAERSRTESITLSLPAEVSAE